MLTVFSSGTISIVKNEWARTNQTEFYRMVARLMPREVGAKVSSQFTLLDALMEMDWTQSKVLLLEKEFCSHCKDQ
jgi:hypothetical protein